MVCDKCGYKDRKEIEKSGFNLCQICNFFAPSSKDDFLFYVQEKLDWKNLETFRKYGQSLGCRQKKGMAEKAKQGKIVTRIALGYSMQNGELISDENASKVHSLFKTFLEENCSLNNLAKKYGLSVNGVKKILQNRTYLGEIKFDGRIHKGMHKPLISPEIFYAVQRKLGEIRRATSTKNS